MEKPWKRNRSVAPEWSNGPRQPWSNTKWWSWEWGCTGLKWETCVLSNIQLYCSHMEPQHKIMVLRMLLYRMKVRNTFSFQNTPTTRLFTYGTPPTLGHNVQVILERSCSLTISSWDCYCLFSGLPAIHQQASHLHARRLPSCTDILDMSPRGNMRFRSVTEDAKKPMVEQTGAATPKELGSSLSRDNNASLRCRG